MIVKVIVQDKIISLTASSNENLLSVLQRGNINIKTDCGARGTCGKCKVKLIKGSLEGVKQDKNGYVLSCKAQVNSDCTILVPNLVYEDESKNDEVLVNNEDSFSIAFDLGTTTLAFALVDTTINKTIKTYTVLNGQSVFGADVISRISASNEGNLQKLCDIVKNQLAEAIEYFSNIYKIKIEKVIVSGNTTMLHLFLAVSPKGIGEAPYTPVFLERKTIKGSKLGLNCDIVEVLPSFSSFVGADITSGVYALNLPNDCMLIDLGTNGELIYRANNKYYGASTAAGPCLEGASIECGIGGVKGAISRFNIDDEEVEYKTIGNINPTGICGAGLVDIIASLLKVGIIDSTGCLEIEEGKYYINGDIYLSQSDIRKFQLAKSAICSGIQSLLIETNKDIKDIKKFYLAGGIGNYINVENAIFTGILPKEAQNKVFASGNSSLDGAIKCLTEKGAIEKMQDIAKNCLIVDLNNSTAFTEGYVNNMFFE